MIEQVNLGGKIGLEQDKKKVKLVKQKKPYCIMKIDIPKKLINNLLNKVMDKKELQVNKISLQ